MDEGTNGISKNRLVDSNGTVLSDYEYGQKVGLVSPSINPLDNFKGDMERAGIYQTRDVDSYNNIYRFGRLHYNTALSGAREFLFFTKPDLHIMDDTTGALNPELATEPFFMDLVDRFPKLLGQLQLSADIENNPLSCLLSNNVMSNLDLPGLSSNTIDTASNAFGTSYEYHGSSEAGDDNHQFSLEFRDNKYTDIYMYFKAYDKYQTLKRHGRVTPKMKYITNRELHDMIGIYKFIVDEDSETIVHFSYFCGVMYTSLPRDVFSNPNFSDGLSYSIDMKTAFVEDDEPYILTDFNALTKSYRDSHTKIDITPFDQYGNMDENLFYKPAKSAYVAPYTDKLGRKRFKLKWRR